MSAQMVSLGARECACAGDQCGGGDGCQGPGGREGCPKLTREAPPRRSLCNREEGSPSPPEEGRGWDQQAREHGGTVIREAWP